MSMNLYLRATLKVKPVFENPITLDKIYELIHSCRLWQTPTDVTNRILASSDIKQAYFDWVMSKNIKETRNIYAETKYDPFCENPIAIEIVDCGQEHIKEVENFLVTHVDWKIEWFSM